MAEKREYKPGIRKIKDFFKNIKVNPNSPRARLERQKAQKQRAKGIGTSGDTDTEFKGQVKNLTKRGMVRKMEDDKPKTTVGAPRAKVASTSAGKAAGKAATKPSTAKKAMAGLSEFGKAFAKARKAGKKDFTFRDRQYAAITKQEVKKAGASSLKDFLNQLKRKESKVVKAKLREGGSATLEEKKMSPEIKKMAERFMKRESGAAVTPDELEELQPRKFERDFDRPRAERLPMRPGMKPRRENLPMRPGMRRQVKPLKERTGAAMTKNELREMSGAGISENEIRRMMQTRSRPGVGGMKKGGSVMARGGRMGKQKPTKLY